jgi:hypothetical protein
MGGRTDQPGETCAWLRLGRTATMTCRTQIAAHSVGGTHKSGFQPLFHLQRGSSCRRSNVAARRPDLFPPGPAHSQRSSHSDVSGIRNRVRISWRRGMPTGGQGADLPDHDRSARIGDNRPGACSPTVRPVERRLTRRPLGSCRAGATWWTRPSTMAPPLPPCSSPTTSPARVSPRSWPPGRCPVSHLTSSPPSLTWTQSRATAAR